VAADARFVAKVSHYEDYLNLKEDPGRYLVTKDKKDWKAFGRRPCAILPRPALYAQRHLRDPGPGDRVLRTRAREGQTALKPLKLLVEEKKGAQGFSSWRD